MIISRDEFHLRYLGTLGAMDNASTRIQYLSVKKLLKEAEADAAYRNHLFLFDGSDLNNVEIPEHETSGIKKKYPHLKTERERLDAIEKELLADTYEPVEISMDADHPSVFYIENGFHRIYKASCLNFKKIRCKVTKGKFRLADEITFEKLPKLLGMVDEMFEGKSNKEIIALLTAEGISKEKAKHTSIGF